MPAKWYLDDETSSVAPLTKSHRRKTYGFLLCAAAVFTVLVIQWSLDSGRLSYDATYDDVGYLVDGFNSLQILDQEGIYSFIKHIASNPPRSPWSSALAIIGFALFGIHDWAPYALNGLLIFAVFVLSERILHTVAWPLRILFVLLMSLTPFMIVAVNEFRPDVAVAFFTAAAVFCAVSGAFAESGERAQRYARIGGCLLGAALLAKPSFFLHTALMGSGALLVFLGGRLRAGTNSSGDKRNVWKSAAEFIGIALLIALPYYLLNWRYVITYFWTVGVSPEGDIWKIKGNFFNTINYYAGFGPAAAMAGAFALLYGSLISFGILMRLLRRQWPQVLFPLVMSGLAGVSLGVMLLGNMRNPFFGLSYQFLLCFTAIGELAYLWKSVWCRYLVVGMVFATAFAQLQIGILHPHLDQFGSSLTLKKNSVHDKILSELQAAVAQIKTSSRPYKVFVTFAGDVNSVSLQWKANTAHADLKFFDQHRSDDLTLFRQAIQSYDFVLLPSADANCIYQWLPSFAIQQEVRNFVNAQHYLKKIAEIPLEAFGARGHLILFQNIATG